MSIPERPGQNPNVLQSSSLEPNKGTIFGTTTTPTRPPHFGDARDDVFHQPARPIPVERPVKIEVNPQKLPLISRLAIVLGSLAIAGGAGLTIQHQIENQETLPPPSIGNSLGAIPQTAEKDYHLALQKLGLEIVVPSTFDSNARKSSIEAGINAVAVSKTDLLKAYTEQVAQNKDSKSPTVIFPVIFTAPGQKVNYEYLAPLTNSTDSVTGKPVTLEFPGRTNVILNKGEEISVLAENAEIFQATPRLINGKPYFVGFFIKFQQNGETFGFRIAGGDVRTFIPIGEATNAPLIPVNEGGTLLLSDAKNGLKVPLGTSIARVNIDTNLASAINLDRYNPQTGMWESVRPNFVIDTSTGQTKLALPLANQ